MGNARLFVPALGGWCVVGVLLGIPQLLAPFAIFLWLAAVTGIPAAIFFPRVRSVLATGILVVVVSALLVSSAAAVNSARRPSELVDAAQHHRFLTLTAVLDEEKWSSESRRPTSVTIVAATIGLLSMGDLSVPALVFGPVPPAGLGTTVTVSGTLDFAEVGERARFLIYAWGSPEIVVDPPWYLGWANTLRERFRTAALELPGDGGALLPGLALGDVGAVSDTLDNAMKSTSLSHLTAVSGANCAVVVGLAMLAMGGVGASRRTRIVVALTVLVGFVILVTPSASVLRAAVMAALVLGSLAAGRSARGLAVLSITVIALLVVDPWLARDYGFILSVLATIGLLVLAGPLSRVMSRWLPNSIAAVISIPLAAQVACQPVLILLNPTIPVYGVLANMLAGPAAPVATVLGLLACVSVPLFEPLGRMLMDIAWVPSAWIAAVAQFFSSAPGAQAPWLPGAIGVALSVIIIALLLIVIFGPRTRWTRILSGALLVVFVSYLGSVFGAEWGRRAAIPADWQIAACDVGQGDAVLVRSGPDVALIDTGPSPEMLSECLEVLGIQHITLLILSHFDLDHVGGTKAVLGRVQTALVGPSVDEHSLALSEALSASGTLVREVSRGETGLLGDLRWAVLWPPQRLGTIEPGNDASVAVRFDGVGECPQRCLSSMFLGDLGQESQSRMLGIVHPGTADVVKVAHHGSADQTERLYQRLQATVGIIGVGRENGYGHPTEALLGVLERAGTFATRTDRNGMILLSPAPGTGVLAWTQRAGP